jgi:hypothetical protein
MPSLSEAPSGGAQPFASFLAFEKGSRCKSETISRRYRSNGYALRQQFHTGLPVTPRITVAHGSINALSVERGASLAAFPRRAWERSIRIPPVGASMLAKNLRAPRADRCPASSLTTIVGTPPGALPERGHAEPKRGTEWWGKAFCFLFAGPALRRLKKGVAVKAKP